MRTASKQLALALVLAGAAFAAATSPGCSAKRCDYDDRNPDDVVISLQCPTGDVCYQGDCRHACEPGREGVLPCVSNGDCTEGALPNCVPSAVRPGFSFCSSCDTSDTCVPALGICQPVLEIALPEQPGSNPMNPPPLPQDGGWIDGSIFDRDSGVVEILPQDVTHVGFIEVREETDFTGAMPRSFPVFNVNFADVRTGSVAQEAATVAQLGQCEITTPTVYTRGEPANLGNVAVFADDDTPTALVPMTMTATFDTMVQAYEYEPLPLPNPTMTLSTVTEGSVFLNVFSGGVPMLTAPWPVNPQPYHVPFKLEMDAATETMLSAPIFIAQPAQDLTFVWSPIPPALARISGEKVSVTIFDPASLYALRCQEIEGFPQSRDNIVILSSLIEQYKMLDGLEAGGDRYVIFERIYEQILEINGVMNVDVVVNVTLQISHTFVGRATF